MSYLNKCEWEILPTNFPIVRRNCPKCGLKENFVNTKKFRVNANGNHIDVWLIYQCHKCKATYKLTIYERTRSEEILNEVYAKLCRNDMELVKYYAFNVSVHSKNKAEINMENIEYDIHTKELEDLCEKENIKEIQICCKYPIQVRMDKLLAEHLKLSRSQVQKMCKEGIIYEKGDQNLMKMKARDGMRVFIVN